MRQARQFYFSRLEAEQQREILAPRHGEQRNRQGEGKRNNVDYHTELRGVPQPHLQQRHTASGTKQSRESEVKTFEEDSLSTLTSIEVGWHGKHAPWGYEPQDKLRGKRSSM